MKNDYESLTHTKWRCQYHIVITPKEPLINHRYFITIDKSVRESSLSRAFSGFGFPVIRS